MFLPHVLESVQKQTVLPSETLVVLSSSGNPEYNFNHELFHFNPVNTSWLRSQLLLPPRREPILAELEQIRRPSDLLVYDVLDVVESAKVTIEAIPNLRLLFNPGNHYAGANRVLGLRESREEIVSFFDCDDYMHPRRFQVIDKVFREHSDVEGLIHGYLYTYLHHWIKVKPYWEKTIDSNLPEWILKPSLNVVAESNKGADQPLTYDGLQGNVNLDSWQPWDFRDIQRKLPVRRTEPNHSKGWVWFFPMHLDLPNARTGEFHNGWLTVRRAAAMDVEYPDMPRGQDSTYIWRFIKAGKNFTAIPHRLGAYLRPNGPYRRRSLKAFWKT